MILRFRARENVEKKSKQAYNLIKMPDLLVKQIIGVRL